ncbi:MAG TPA: hypothetical protein DCE41_12050 [Cytophagales bacterium]|nr:hypothetical protein [Cytophagales bacterium]
MNPLDDLKNAKVSREQLEKAEAGFREAIEQQLDVLEDSVSKWGRTFLVASGTALLGFGVVQFITKGRSTEEEDEVADSKEGTSSQPAESSENVPVLERIASPIVQQIKEQMALFLAALVKQKLMEFLERINRLDGEEIDNPKAEAADDQPTE